ncbi:TVP38/TMEM64 family protein [Clostridium sp. BSD9I1]|uniref:TVP38/TMEM64 family protein n=1 Tax=Clostridium sp. BSD9I1 TaxID=2003589 RepID=UPI0016465673|nr:VTT domain-containing protein [Clostridium sp. BSD9I1]
MLNNIEFKKFDLIMPGIFSIISIYMLQFILVGLLPIYKTALTGALILFYILLLHSQFIKEQRNYNLFRNTITYLFIFISIWTVITLISSVIVLIHNNGLEYILKRSSSVGKLIYFLICFLQPIILPLPEPVTIMAGSAVFGSTYGFIIGISGTIVGVITMFWIAKVGGNKLVNKLVEPKQIEKYKKFIIKNEIVVLIGLFILPILPDEVICVGAGISGISFKKFIVIAVLSKIITILAYSQSLQLTNLI